MTQKTSDQLLLICNLNVFVMAYIFDPQVMLEGGEYSFGKIYVHLTVLDELCEWEYSEAKKTKFTPSVIKSMINKCVALKIDGPLLAEEEKNKIFRRMDRDNQNVTLQAS